MKENLKICLVKNEEILKKEQERLYLLYLNCDGSAEDIRKIAKLENISSKLFVSLICSYIDKYIEKSGYAIIFEKLDSLLLEDELSIINYLDSLNLPISIIENNLIPYIIKYRPEEFLNREDKLLISLRKKINLYKHYLATGQLLSKNKKSSNVEVANDTITKFISSNFSIERFCIHERISHQIFKQRLATIKVESNKEKRNAKENNQEESTTLYDIYINSLNIKNQIFQETITDNIYSILNLVKELENDFCSIDLFMNTNYGGNEILKSADNILSVEDSKLFRRYVSVYKKVEALNTKAIENLLNERSIININNQIIEIDNKVKFEIISFLEENNIPIFYDSFRNACNRYYQEKLYPSKHR